MGRELRAEARIPISQRGALNSGETWFPCLLVDASENGFAMLCNRNLAIEQTLDFRCQLYRDTTFECMVEVRHFSDDVAGVMITNIDERARDLWKSYVDHHFFAKRTKRTNS